MMDMMDMNSVVVVLMVLLVVLTVGVLVAVRVLSVREDKRVHVPRPTEETPTPPELG